MFSSQVKFSADRQTDKRTPVKHYAHDLSMRGHKKERQIMFLRTFGGNGPWIIDGCINLLGFKYYISQIKILS